MRSFRSPPIRGGSVPGISANRNRRRAARAETTPDVAVNVLVACFSNLCCRHCSISHRVSFFFRRKLGEHAARSARICNALMFGTAAQAAGVATSLAGTIIGLVLNGTGNS